MCVLRVCLLGGPIYVTSKGGMVYSVVGGQVCVGDKGKRVYSQIDGVSGVMGVQAIGEFFKHLASAVRIVGKINSIVFNGEQGESYNKNPNIGLNIPFTQDSCVS